MEKWHPYCRPPTRRDRFNAFMKWLLYTVIGLSADGLHTILLTLRIMPAERPITDYRSSSVDELTDADLRSRFLIPQPTLSEEAGVDLCDLHVDRYSDDTVAKWSFNTEETTSEDLAMDLVFRQTSIPVPRIRHVLRFPETYEICTIMDFIPGRQLRYAWPTMSLFSKLRLAFTLRGYIRQLRAIDDPRSRIPGPLAEGTEACSPICQMMIGVTERSRPPFNTYSDFSAWWNDRCPISRRVVPEIHVGVPPEPFDDSQPLVLTHCDINMRNIILGNDGRVYLIDWGLSGFYPQWFEYVNWRYWIIAGFGEKDSELERTDWLWNAMIPFITMGPYWKQERWFWRVVPIMDNYN